MHLAIDALTAIADVLGMFANSFWVQSVLRFPIKQNLENEITDDMIKNINQISENKIEQEIEEAQQLWNQVFPMIENVFKMAARQHNFIPNIEKVIDEFLFSFSQMPYLKSFIISKQLVEKMSKLSQRQDAMQIMKMFTELKEKTSSSMSETTGRKKQD